MNTNVDYQTYFKKYPSAVNITRTQFLRDKIHNDYIEQGKLGKQHYFEIGFGSGATVEQFGPHFNNLVLLEPNPNYIAEVDAKLRRNENINKYRFTDDLLDDDWDPNNIFTSQELNDGMDLIVASQCLWYLPPNYGMIF